MNCGKALSEPSEDDEALQARLSAAAPAPLIAKMREARLSGERKPVTAIFADVVGSTSLAETMDPEDWTVMINEAFDLMSKAVFRYEGTIAQLQGDAIPLGARILHLVEDVEELRMMGLRGDELYKKAAQEAREGAGKSYDPKVVEVFTEVLANQQGIW